MSSDAAKRCVARIVKNRFGVCEGKMQVVQMIFVNETALPWLHQGEGERLKYSVTQILSFYQDPFQE